MAVPKPHDGPTADRDRDWNWSEQGGEQIDKMVEQGGWKQVAEAHAWYDDSDGDPPEKKGAYKLPHHELAGGRVGVDIPGKEKQAVWRHLARHYQQFDEEPPELS